MNFIPWDICVYLHIACVACVGHDPSSTSSFHLGFVSANRFICNLDRPCCEYYSANFHNTYLVSCYISLFLLVLCKNIFYAPAFNAPFLPSLPLQVPTLTQTTHCPHVKPNALSPALLADFNFSCWCHNV